MYEAWFKYLVGAVGSLIGVLYIALGKYFLFALGAYKRELDGYKTWQETQDTDIKKNTSKIDTQIGLCKGIHKGEDHG